LRGRPRRSATRVFLRQPCEHRHRERGDAGADSDADIVVELDAGAGVGLFALVRLERRLSELLGRVVDLLTEPVEKPRLRAKIDRDRRRAF
jgi:uncharacterized protein